MGVRGLLSHCLRNRAECVEEVNLVTVAQSRGGIEILVDFYCFDHYVIEKLSDSLNKVSKNTSIHVQGGEYRTVDEFVRKLYTDLQAVGITLVTVKDGAKGSSKVMTEVKLDTWKSRFQQNMGKLREAVYALRGQQYISKENSDRPVLIEIQILDSLRSCGGEVIECPSGEADYVLAKSLSDRPKAFAIFTNDSDFCIFKGCAFCPPQLFDLNDDLYLGKDQLLPRAPKGRLRAGVIQSDRVVQSLGLANHSALVELSIVAGNDFTGPHMNERLRGKFGLRSNRVGDVAVWVRRYRSVENHHVLREEMRSHGEFAQRVAHSRRFYSLDPNIDNERRAKPELTQFIEDHVRQGHYPSAIYAMHLRFYWHRLILEDLAVGAPIAEVAFRPLRRHFYNMLLLDSDQSVVEHGRNEDQRLVSMEIEMSEMRGLPVVTAINPDDTAQNLETFVRIITHFEPQFQVEDMETYNQKTRFVLYLLRYFANITVGQNLHITEAEFEALFVTTLCSVDVGDYQKMAIRPSIRSVTVGNWFQTLYRQACKLLAPLLHLQSLFPQPCEVFSGAVWTAFYMANAEPDRLQTQGFAATVFQRIVKDKDVVMKKHQEGLTAVKRGFFM